MGLNYDILSTNNRIILKRNTGIVLILENFTKFQKSIYQYLKSISFKYNIPFKVGILSYPYEINDETFESISEELQNKEKFIAPIIDGFFVSLENKKYDLVIFNSKKIYDLDDFSEEISSKFNRIFIETINNNCEEQGIPEMISRKIFDFSFKQISITPLLPAVPVEWDDELTLDIENKKASLSLKKIGFDQTSKSEFLVVFRSHLKKIPVNVEIDSKITEIEVECDTNFAQPLWKELTDDECEVFKIHIDNYLLENLSELFCPLCNCRHKFDTAFLCKKQRGDILRGHLSTGRIIFKSIENNLEKNLLFQMYQNKVRVLAINKSMFEVEELNFIFNSKQGIWYKIFCNDNSYQISSAKKIFSNLYQIDSNNFVYKNFS